MYIYETGLHAGSIFLCEIRAEAEETGYGLKRQLRHCDSLRYELKTKTEKKIEV